ncbi:MAG: amino acid ABC transporter permease [Erysipelotrichaceae bacterium]
MEEFINLLPSLLGGCKVTLSLFALTLIISIPLSLILSGIRSLKLKPVNMILSIYIYIERGTPLLLQLMLIFFGLPKIGITFDRYPAALLAFLLNYTAYFTEIFRGGINSIDEGQFEASKVLGLSNIHTFNRIIFPQAIKNTIPSIGNEVLALIKDTSLVSIISLEELLRVGNQAAARMSSILPFIYVGVIYLVLTFFITQMLNFIEKKFNYYK